MKGEIDNSQAKEPENLEPDKCEGEERKKENIHSSARKQTLPELISVYVTQSLDLSLSFCNEQNVIPSEGYPQFLSSFCISLQEVLPKPQFYIISGPQAFFIS